MEWSLLRAWGVPALQYAFASPLADQALFRGMASLGKEAHCFLRWLRQPVRDSVPLPSDLLRVQRPCPVVEAGDTVATGQSHAERHAYLLVRSERDPAAVAWHLDSRSCADIYGGASGAPHTLGGGVLFSVAQLHVRPAVVACGQASGRGRKEIVWAVIRFTRVRLY